jgi:hypothetical protein
VAPGVTVTGGAGNCAGESDIFGFNLAPLAYKEFHHIAFIQCGYLTFNPGVDCTVDGNRSFNTTWAIETNWDMNLGFLPENMQFFSISGRAAWYGPKGDQNSPLVGTGVGRFFANSAR